MCKIKVTQNNTMVRQVLKSSTNCMLDSPHRPRNIRVWGVPIDHIYE